MRLRKYNLPKSFTMVTFSTEEGLPFVCCEFMNLLIWSALARAQNLYPVKICGFVVEPNHVHILIYVENPEDLSGFVKIFKQETAHYLSRLLGRKKKTTWCAGYDSPTILDSEKALEMYTYAILNPVKDCLVNCMSEYPGVSSYKMLISDVTKKEVPLISRSSIPKLKDPTKPWLEDKEIIKILKNRNKNKITLEVSPYVFKEGFHELKDKSNEEIKVFLMQKIEEKNKEYLSKRGSKKVVGAESLRKASMVKEYHSERGGRRMLCLSFHKDLRRIFIETYKYLKEKAERVYQNWKKGDYSIPFPPGLFAPNPPRLANLFLCEYS